MSVLWPCLKVTESSLFISFKYCKNLLCKDKLENLKIKLWPIRNELLSIDPLKNKYTHIHFAIKHYIHQTNHHAYLYLLPWLQSPDKALALQQFSQFCRATVNEQEQIAHKLLGKQFQVCIFQLYYYILCTCTLY